MIYPDPMKPGGTRDLFSKIWAEVRSDPPSLPLPKIRSARSLGLWAVGLVVLLCCGWIGTSYLGDLLGDLKLFLIPAFALLAIFGGAVFAVKRGVKKTRVVLIALVLVLVTPVAAFVLWAGKETIDAGKGAACPGCAVGAYINDSPGGSIGGDSLLFERTLCKANKVELKTQAAQYFSAYQAALDKWDLDLELTHGATDDRINGDRGTIVVEMTHSHKESWQNGGGYRSRSQHRWTFEVVQDNGWRVCQVTMPEVCTVVNCAGPTTPAVPSDPPVRTDWDTRVSWRCFDDAPPQFRPFGSKACQAPPEGWTQPGPYYCDPSYPLPVGQAEVKECRKRGWIK